MSELKNIAIEHGLKLYDDLGNVVHDPVITTAI